MHVRIRKLTSQTKENDLVLKVSKTATIESLQEMIYNKLNVKIEQQKLYYRGKELISDHRITDYDIKLNDVIQLLIKTTNKDPISNENENKSPTKKDTYDGKKPDFKFETESRYYKKGDRIDVVDNNHGAWFEAKILNIFTNKRSNNLEESDLIFQIQMDRNVQTAPLEVNFNEIRPRSHYVYKHQELKPGMTVFVNYNIEKPSTRGYWYDFELIKITSKYAKGTLLVGKDHTRIEDCTVKFIDEIMRIEKVIPLNERIELPEEIPLRKLPLYCNKCKDDVSKKCKECGCKVCAKKDDAGVLILCDECDGAYHLSCLDPPLSEIPSDEWYCPDCKTDENEIVKAGEKLKTSKKKMKMASNKKEQTTRDWGKGMACVGRTTECTIVPKDHYGPIPGVEVGTCWKFRMQVSEAGIHRPHVAGIHGRETDGAYSLILSGGYEDDIDYGDEFYYTGSGGRDLSGNKRVNEQSWDQELTRMNKALALNCNVKFNDKVGGEAKDWKNGKPVRVVRNYKLRKHSKYAPIDGNRYDGIYKVVKYYPEKGKSGHIVWRYLLKRDDPTPAPWAKGGQEFEMIYPPGYLECEEVKEAKGRKTTKRKLPDTPNNSITNYLEPTKKPKIQPFKIPAEVKQLINKDSINAKLWNECKEVLKEGRQKFLNKVEEIFMCVCCQEVVYEPITLSCKHNVCKGCLTRSFASEIYACPWCRFELTKNYVMDVNDNLAKALKILFPGYESGR